MEWNFEFIRHFEIFVFHQVLVLLLSMIYYLDTVFFFVSELGG